MQGLSSKARQGGPRRGRQAGRLGLEAGAVDRIAEQGVAGMGEMDANLMGPAGFQPAFDQAGGRLAILSQNLSNTCQWVVAARPLARIAMRTRLVG